MTNKDIVDSNLDLIRECVDYQFAKTKSEFDQQNKEDFFQDLIIILYTYDNDKLNDALSKGRGTLNALITRIIINQVFSKTSEYWRKYKQFLHRSEEINTEDDDTDI